MALTRAAKIAVLSTGLVLFFLGVALLILPNVLVNRPETKAAVARYLGDALGGAVGFEGLRLSLFPRPCVTARDVHLDLPERLAGRAVEIDICLKPLALLQGRVAVDSARLRSPELLLPFSALRPGAGLATAPDPRQILLSAAAALQRIPDGALEILDGRLAFSDPGGRRIEFRGLNLQALRRAAGLQWDLSGESDFLRSFSSSARLDLDAVSGSLAMKMVELRPGGIYDLLWPEAPVRLLDGHADLDVSMKLGGPDQLKAVIDGRRAALALRRRDREAGIRIERLAAELELSPRKLSIRIPELAAEHPRAAAELFLAVDEDSQPRIVLGLKGSADLTAAREVALAMLPEIPDARLVCDILRGGEIRRIQVNLQGNSWADLAEPDNLRIQGRLENGRVGLPWIDLDLDEVSGDASIAGGILEGRDLKAHYKGTRGENGTLRVGLSSARPVLQLDIFARAELSPLPPLLARLVSDPMFRKQAALVQEFSGTAQGTLRLNGTHTDVAVEVQASELEVKARHQHIPYPLRFQGGEFAYGGDSIRLRGVDVALGDSRLFKHDLTLGLSGNFPLESSSPKAVIDQSEIFNMFRDLPPFNHLHRMAGVFTFNNWQLKGQAFAPATWMLSANGTVQDLSVESELLPGLLSLPSGSFDWLGQTIRYRGAKGSISSSRIKELAVEADWMGPPRVQLRALELDASLDDITHLIRSFPKAAAYTMALHPMSGTVRMRDVKFQTRLLPEGPVLDQFAAVLQNSVVTSAPIGLPLTLTAGNIGWQGSKLELQIAKASLGQSEIQNLSVSGDWSIEGVLELRVDNTIIECGEIFPRMLSLAGLKSLREDVRGIQGTLSASHVSLKGPIQDPERWRTQAVAELKNIVVTTTFLDEPIALPEGRLTLTQTGPPEAGATALRLDTTRVRIGSDEAVLAGEIALSAADTALQLVVTAGAVDWDRIAKISDRLALRRSADSRPLRGVVHLRLERLVIDPVHLYPFYANVQLAADGVRVEIQRSSFCSMLFIGRLAFDGPMVDAYLVPVVDVMPIDGVVACLSEERSIFSGYFNLNGWLSFKGRREDVLQALNGRLTFVAEDGTIRQSLLFARLFSLLNLTEIYRGKLPDFRSQGLDYKRSIAHIEVKEGKILISDWSIDGPTLWLGSRGEIDIATQEIDFTIMVSPFKTVDRIINSIPGLRWILGGRLVAVPMKAVGTLEDPRFIPLSPSAVGTSILEMIERTLLLPIEIIQPLVPGMEESASGTISR
jgi:hypothetical protein